MPKNPEREGSPILLTIDQIAAKHGVSRSSVHTYRRGGTFPRPVPVEGTTRVLFDAGEVAAWFKANPKQQGRRTDLPAKKPKQGDPMTTSETRPQSVEDVVTATLQSVQGTVHHLAPLTFTVLAEKLTAALTPYVAAQRAAVLREAADRLDESETLRDYTDDHMGDVHATTAELRCMADETEAQGE